MTDLSPLEAFEALEALEDLGGTAEDVGRNLLIEGCKGLPGTATKCPVATFLQRKSGRLVDDLKSVPPVFMWAVDGERADDGFYSVPLPEPVRDFIRSFDAGNYPELRLKQSDVELKA